MKTKEKEKEYHASYIVYEQAMLHIHRLTTLMKDKYLANDMHYEIMRSLRKSVEIAVEKEKKHIEDAYDYGLANGLDWGADDNNEPDFANGEEYYKKTYGHYN